jgi:Uma2 family endonuclease
VRVQTRATSYRVPDVAVLSRSNPVEQIITIPPIAVLEVLSPSDTITKMLRKLADYSSMGIPQIWIVDPDTGNFFWYAEGSVSGQPTSRAKGLSPRSLRSMSCYRTEGVSVAVVESPAW